MVKKLIKRVLGILRSTYWWTLKKRFIIKRVLNVIKRSLISLRHRYLPHISKKTSGKLVNLRLKIANIWVLYSRLRNANPSKEDAKRDVKSEFLLCRTLGNDHYPRHADRQTLTNLRFILEHEPDFEGCRKFFIVNRIFDPLCEQELIAELDKHGADYVVLPFSGVEFKRSGWRLEDHSKAEISTNDMAGFDFFRSKRFAKMNPTLRIRYQAWALAPKICYAMNVNGARNIALDEGRRTANWTFPLDGSCILTQQSFQALASSCHARPFAPYVVVPFQRLKINNAYFGIGNTQTSLGEPQLGFHHTAGARFEPSLPYGINNKVELLERLGVPGEWTFLIKKLVVPKIRAGRDRFHFKHSKGGTFRLSSGGSGGALEDLSARSERGFARLDAIIRTILNLIQRFGTENEAYLDHIFGDERKNLAPDMPSDRQLDRPDKAIDHLAGRRMFIGIGAMKSGTSWVSDYLASHPEVFHSPIKEIGFFSTLVPNPLVNAGKSSRARRRDMVLSGSIKSQRTLSRSRYSVPDLDELDRLNQSPEAYLEYFAKRIGDERGLGEFSPNYALLPPSGYANMANLGLDVRLILLMRDPVARAASNLTHIMSRGAGTKWTVDEMIERLAPNERVYERCNYMRTIESVKQGAPDTPFKTFVFEDLFTPESVRSLCEFLDIEYHTPNLERAVNKTKVEPLSDARKARIREKLDPLYHELAAYFGEDKPPQWDW